MIIVKENIVLYCIDRIDRMDRIDKLKKSIKININVIINIKMELMKSK